MRVFSTRFGFFLLAGAVAAAMIPVTDAKLRWVPAAVAIAYVVLAVLFLIDDISRSRTR